MKQLATLITFTAIVAAVKVMRKNNKIEFLNAGAIDTYPLWVQKELLKVKK